MIFRKKQTFFIDENIKMSDDDIEKLKCTVINCTDKFPKGTDDEILTDACKENGWIMVTKDIRCALRSLMDEVSVVYIDDVKNKAFFIESKICKKIPDFIKTYILQHN